MLIRWNRGQDTEAIGESDRREIQAKARKVVALMTGIVARSRLVSAAQATRTHTVFGRNRPIGDRVSPLSRKTLEIIASPSAPSAVSSLAKLVLWLKDGASQQERLNHWQERCIAKVLALALASPRWN